MAFSSIPVYLDPPNWQQNLQQPNQQQEDGSSCENTHHHQLLPPMPPPPPPPHSAAIVGSIRPSSMSERARMAKIPQPEAGLKCPRCDSTNTKFCYFNNYSLTQPRHFCKTCRRYWTRGGALRNVPVGGGCRRNKRSKRSRSKSPATASAVDCQPAGSSSSTTTGDLISHLPPPPPPPQLPFLPSLLQLGGFGAGYTGLNFGGIQTSLPEAARGGEMEFQIGGANSTGAGPLLSSRFAEQLRLQQVQQFPFFTGLGQSTASMYQFENDGVEPSSFPEEEAIAHQPSAAAASRALDSVGVTQIAAVVKPEEGHGFNLSSRGFLGLRGNDQYWGTAVNNAWTDLTGFNNSSSANHLL